MVPQTSQFLPMPPLPICNVNESPSTSCKVYMILDEFFLAGEVQETSKQIILHRVQDLDKLE